jgi:hypothetical protein
MVLKCNSVKLLRLKILKKINKRIRSKSLLKKLKDEEMWKGVKSVRNEGRKSGRGKGVGKKMEKNIKRGKIIGVGKKKIIWNGLNVKVLRGRELVKKKKLKEDKESEKKIIKLRDDMGNLRNIKLSNIERGW